MGLPIGLDPRELQRRQILSAIMSSQATGPSTELTSAISRQPNYAQYQPSRARRILSDIAGGAMGAAFLNPILGQKVAKNISDQPFRQSQERFQSSIQPLLQQEELRNRQLQQTNELRKALSESYERTQRGEAETSKAETEAYKASPQGMLRQYGYQPQTLGEAEELKRSGIRPLAPHFFTNESTGDLQEVDPSTGKVESVAKGVKETTAEKTKQRAEEERQKHLYRSQEISQREKAIADRKTHETKKAAEKGVTPAQEQMVYENLFISHPEFQKFLPRTASGRYFVKPSEGPDWKAFQDIRAAEIAKLHERINKQATTSTEEESDWEEEDAE